MNDVLLMTIVKGQNHLSEHGLCLMLSFAASLLQVIVQVSSIGVFHEKCLFVPSGDHLK